jgi:hypothetical protein
MDEKVTLTKHKKSFEVMDNNLCDLIGILKVSDSHNSGFSDNLDVIINLLKIY